MMDRSRCTLLLATLALAAVVALSPGAALAKKPSGCKRPGSSTEAKSELARVFSARREIEGDPEGKRLYGCLWSAGRPLALSDAYDDGYVSSEDWSDVRLAGRFAAWTASTTDVSCKADCPPGYSPTKSRIGIADLRRRKIRVVVGASVFGGGLVLTTGGAIAWTEKGDPGTVAVRAVDRDGQRTLDSGAIAPSSLSLEGSTVSWEKDGVRNSATLR